MKENYRKSGLLNSGVSAFPADACTNLHNLMGLAPGRYEPAPSGNECCAANAGCGTASLAPSVFESVRER